MAHMKKGQIAAGGAWRKHLRPDGHKVFWSKERQAESLLVRKVKISHEF
jgi:hypothetical protein